MAINFGVPQYYVNATKSFFVQFLGLGPHGQMLDIMPSSKDMELKTKEHIHNFLEPIV
jgi:hypothetical protein